jgi:hypothetical protein
MVVVNTFGHTSFDLEYISMSFWMKKPYVIFTISSETIKDIGIIVLYSKK